MKALDRELFREVVRLRGQAITIAIVVASGVACYIALQSAWRALYESRDLYYETNRFADVFVHLKRAPKSVASQIAELPGVARAYPRIVERVRLPMDDLDLAGSGRPDLGRRLPEKPPLNGLLLRAGRRLEPGRYDEVLVNEPFAKAHGLEPGDHLTAVINGKLRDLLDRRARTLAGIRLCGRLGSTDARRRALHASMDARGRDRRRLPNGGSLQ